MDLESIKGIVVGSMTKMKDNDIPWVKMPLKLLKMLPKNTIFPFYISLDTFKTIEP
jgi:muramoyltetrapeptide carboxypeptidase